MANSWSTDGHKTLNAPYDNGLILCKHKDVLVNAIHMTGSYIIYSEQRDCMFFTPDMSRRARVIELWATLKSLCLFPPNGQHILSVIIHNRYFKCPSPPHKKTPTIRQGNLLVSLFY